MRLHLHTNKLPSILFSIKLGPFKKVHFGFLINKFTFVNWENPLKAMFYVMARLIFKWKICGEAKIKKLP